MSSVRTAPSKAEPRDASSREASLPGRARPPVIELTRYDRVSSAMIAVVLGLLVSVVSLSTVYLSYRPSRAPQPAPLELVELAGGFEDGAIDETLKVESPEEAVKDAAPEEAPADEHQIEEVLENVVELSDLASRQIEQQFEFDAENAGRRGSAHGTGRRGLGEGPGDAGLPRDKRWFISFSERGTLDEYARQLDFFGIELGALLPGKLVYLSELASDQPRTRTVESGRDEQRLYMNWQGGSRRLADAQLFQKAGIDAAQSVIFHFYPPQTEAQLARLERDYAGRPADQIRRTYFVVRPVKDGGYEFVVTRQVYFH